MKIKSWVSRSLLVLSLVFFSSSCMMMSHHSKCGSHQHSNSNQTENSIIDPVCGSVIDFPNEAYSFYYQNYTYYFHSANCMNEFRNSPEKFIQNNSHTQHKNNNKMLWGVGSVAMGAMMVVMLLKVL